MTDDSTDQTPAGAAEDSNLDGAPPATDDHADGTRSTESRTSGDQSPSDQTDADGRPQSDAPNSTEPEAEADAYDQGAVGAVPVSQEGPPVTSREGEHDGPAAEPDPLEQAETKRDEYLNQLLRARADYDNLNKRRLKEVAAARDRGAAAVIEGLLEVLDNFGFALKAAGASEDAQLAKGVQLVHGQLLDALAQSGLEQVEGEGSVFDPSHHEALMSDSDDTEREHPEVAEVLRVGYRFKDQLLRPASVRVLE